MRKLYLIGIVVTFLFVLILILPQVGAVCTWYAPIRTTTLPILPLFQATALGGVLGGLFILYWKAPKPGQEAGGDDSDGDDDDK